MTKERTALPADHPSDQPAGNLPGLPRLSFPEQPAGQGPAPAPGGYSPQPGYAPPGEMPPGEMPPGEMPPGGMPPGGGPPGLQPGQRQREPWQSGGGPAAPGRRAPSRRPEREVQQRAFAGLVFALLAVIALLGAVGNVHRGIYLVIFTLIAGPGACVLGITAMRRARRAGTWRPRGAIGATIIGGLSTVLGIVTLAAFTLFSQQLSVYSQCLNQAQTPSAQQACQTQFERSVDARIQQTGASG